LSTCQKNENVADIVEGAYPEEVADAVVFLAPIKLPSLKDKLFSVNGGSTMQ
jgi:2,3-dihydroxy-2,3-dihydro-p-cumate dehydrogenase